MISRSLIALSVFIFATPDLGLATSYPLAHGCSGGLDHVTFATLICDDNGLARCLQRASRDFYECEAVCSDLHLDDNLGYTDCRNECRDEADAAEQNCYDLQCSSASKEVSP